MTARWFVRRGAVLGGLLLGVGLLVPACGDDGSRPAASTSAPTPSRPSTQAPEPSVRDGSLGDPNSKRACTLLTQDEIEAQFGGPVGAATPIFPYCQWLVGEDAFVAVTVLAAPIEQVRATSEVRFEVAGLGDSAFVASTRALVFGSVGISYSILWQKVGDFTTVETERLGALAQAVLGRV